MSGNAYLLTGRNWVKAYCSLWCLATDNLWACKDCWLINLYLKKSRESYSSSVRLFGKDTSSPIFSSAILGVHMWSQDGCLKVKYWIFIPHQLTQGEKVIMGNGFLFVDIFFIKERLFQECLQSFFSRPYFKICSFTERIDTCTYITPLSIMPFVVHAWDFICFIFMF